MLKIHTWKKMCLVAGMLGLSQFAMAQDKNQLISEVIRLTGSSNAAAVIAQGEKEQLIQLIPPLFGKALEDNKTLSMAQKQAAIPRIEKEVMPRIAKSAGAVFDTPGFKADVQSNQLAAYNRFFTPNELQDIVNFLKSPSGAKFVANQPKVNEMILENLFKKYRPAAVKDLQNAIDREVKSIK